MKLSTEQRVLLHLSRFAGKEGRWEAPYEVSQAGISASLHLPQSTVSRVLKSLKERGMVEDRVMYIRGEKRKKSAYFLTTEGRRESENLIGELLKDTVRIRLDGEIKDVSVAEALNIARDRGIDAHPLELEEEMEKEGFVDMDTHRSSSVVFHVPPYDKGFIGREDVIGEVLRWMEKSPVILIKGMAGMGKSALLSVLAHRLSRDMNVFWYGIRAGRGHFHLIKEMNEFLRVVGRKPVERKMGARGFFMEMRDLDALLIFDDLHMADEPTLGFIREFAGMMFEEPCRCRVIVSSREDIEIGRTVEIARGKLHEITLKPLKKEEIADLFPEEDIETVYSVTGGIPLFIQLYRNADFRVSDAERIVEEEVFSGLSDAERGVLEMMAVHRIPVYPEAFGDFEPEILRNLMKKLLLFEVERGKMDMHDLLKEMIYRQIPLERRKELHIRAAEYYLSQWCDEKDRFEAVYHLQMADEWERATEVALTLASGESLAYAEPVLAFAGNMHRVPEELRGELLLLVGDVLSNKGMWEEALGAYRDAQTYLGEMEEIKERVAAANMGMENWEESLRMETELLESARRRKDRHEIAKHLIRIGNIHLRSGRLEKAMERYTEALELMKSLKYREGMAVVENNIGTVYIRMGLPEKAQRHIMESLMHSRSRGKAGIRALTNLAYVYELMGNPGEAERTYREVLKMSDDPGTSIPILERLISVMLQQDKWGEAIALAKSYEMKVPEELRWRVLDMMADAYRRGRMYDEAVDARKRAISYADRAETRLNLVGDLIFAGRISEALQILEEERRRLLPWEQNTLMRLLELRGRALALKGDRKGAVESYMEAMRLAEELGEGDTLLRIEKILQSL